VFYFWKWTFLKYMNIKFNNIIAILLVFFSCQSPNKLQNSFTEFDHLAIKEKTIILSCIKCKCIVDELNKYHQKYRIDTTKYTIYGDSTCLSGLSKKIAVNHLSQNYIDSCSVDFYNMVILTKRNSKIQHKEVTTNEAKYLDRFLNN
jgi:hypothetical protein